MPDAHANLAYSLVATAPVPAASGTSLIVTTGEGTRFPTVPFNATVWATAAIPIPTNAEIVRVTNITGDTLTITRAQEGTSARTIVVGDQIAATITNKTLTDIETDVSNEISARALSIQTLSAAVTSVDTHAAAASAAATSADGHANTVSAAVETLSAKVVSVSAQLTSLEVHASAASAAATSVNARVTSVLALHDVLSNVVSDSLSAGNVASNLLSVLSDRVVSISAQLTSLEVHASTASAAATSADGHANAASAAATSVNARVTSVNAAISAISARSVGDVSTHGFQSVINALSGRISAIVAGAASVTSAEVQTLSNAVTSVDTHANAASAAATSADAHANTASAAATSADAHANTVSAAVETLSAKVVSVSAQLTSLEVHASAASAAATSVLAIVNAISANSVGGVATEGLQSAINALSNRISAIPGGTSTPAIRILSVAATVDANTLTVASGYSVTVSAGVTYKLEALALVNRISTHLQGYGIRYPAVVNGIQGGGFLHINTSAVQSVGLGGTAGPPFRGDNAVNSILASISAGGIASIVVFARGMLQMSAGGKVALLFKTSGAGGIIVLPGSYLELKRIS